MAVILGAGCSGGAREAAPVTVDGETVSAAGLREAVAGLCQARDEARRDPEAATATFRRRSRHGLLLATRALAASNAILADRITKALPKVDAGRAGPEDLAELAELLRDGLSRLGIPTAPCT